MNKDLRAIEELDQNIVSICTTINLATYELLTLVREFDEHAGFLQWGLENSAGDLRSSAEHRRSCANLGCDC